VEGGGRLDVTRKFRDGKVVCLVDKPCEEPGEPGLEKVAQTCKCEYEVSCEETHKDGSWIQVGDSCVKEEEGGPRKVLKARTLEIGCPTDDSTLITVGTKQICEKKLSSCDKVKKEKAFSEKLVDPNFLLMTGICGPRIKENMRVMLTMMTRAMNPLLFLQEGRKEGKFVGPKPTAHLKLRIQCISTCAAAFAKFSECWADNNPYICKGGNAGASDSAGLQTILEREPPPKRSKEGPYKDIFFTCTSDDPKKVPHSNKASCGVPTKDKFPLYGVSTAIPCKSMYDSDLTMSEDIINSKSKAMDKYTEGLSTYKMSEKRNSADLKGLSCAVAWCQNAQMKHKDAIQEDKRYTFNGCLGVCRNKDPLWSEDDIGALDDKSLKKLEEECLLYGVC